VVHRQQQIPAKGLGSELASALVKDFFWLALLAGRSCSILILIVALAQGGMLHPDSMLFMRCASV
jgi:hypothetical protein